jgi:predicted dehydrogenase
MKQQDSTSPSASRRAFLKTSTAAVGVGVASTLAVPRVHAAEDNTLRVGLIGCGGRGTGAAVQALKADPNTQLVAIGDAFEDRAELSLKSIRRSMADQVAVDDDHVFVGFDAYKGVIDSDVDVVLLAATPHFRAKHLKACIDAGKHVFAEKPVAVDAPGVQSVLETCELARQKSLSVVSGLCWRYETNTLALMRRLHDGAIGEITSLDTTRYGGGVWVRPREDGMTEMQYQMRNWYYFNWLSGDFITEQFVHELDRMAWVMQDEYPVACIATGGRQSRTGAEHGHIYDHFACQFQYAGGATLFATCRHQKGCSGMFTVRAVGTKGSCDLQKFEIAGENPWSSGQRRTAMHQLEHDAMYAALRRGETINNGVYMAKSTMMALMARMSAYTGQKLSWDQAMNSKELLAPASYAWDADPPPAEVAIPGVTKFV